MDKVKILNVLTNIVGDYLQTQNIKISIDKNTPLIGRESKLDSIGLVNVIIDIESSFLDEDLEISLTSEKAMSMRMSPFRTIETLSEYIFEQIGESHE
jgi:acyl carrier protein